MLEHWSTPKPEVPGSLRKSWDMVLPSDAFHITSPAEDGEGAARAMQFAIDEAEIVPDDVDYINAHGTSTPANDKFETKAIKTTFGRDAKDLKISSTKSMIGHGLGAAGAIEFITCVKTVLEDYIHPTVDLRCRMRNVTWITH